MALRRRADRFCPLTTRLPEVGRSIEAISLTSVVLPAPEWPVTSTISPAKSRKLISRRLRSRRDSALGQIAGQIRDHWIPLEQRVDEIFAENGRRSSICSPTPMKRIGFGHWRAMAAMTPPLAVPSSLVRTRPVTLIALSKALTCCQGVLADVGVEHQQRFVRALGLGLLDHPAHLGDFFHQVQLGRQAAGGVGQHDVDAARLGGGNGIEDHGRRVAGFLRDDRHVVALAPGLQLLAGSGAEGVAGGQQHALALAWKYLASLPMEVVLPAPLTPAIMITYGLCR
jgi:hypothetical protein